jgi:ribosomal protein S18 acetylase RimI-like enzyme
MAAPDSRTKIAGLGFSRRFDDRDLARVEAAFGAAGGGSASSCRRSPTRRSRHAHAPWLRVDRTRKRARPALTADRVATSSARSAAAREIEIVRAGTADLPLWRDTVIEGFMHPDAFDGPPPTESFDREMLRGVFEESSLTPGIVAYLARRNGEVAGAGSVRIAEGLAQMSGASTLPSHRRRGVQSALLGARLVDAARAGCDLAITCTEPASKSQQNMQRAGFELLYSRAVLVRSAPKSSTGDQ